MNSGASDIIVYVMIGIFVIGGGASIYFSNRSSKNSNAADNVPSQSTAKNTKKK